MIFTFLEKTPSPINYSMPVKWQQEYDLCVFCVEGMKNIPLHKIGVSHLPPGERGYGHTGMSRVLNVTVLRGLSQTIQEVVSRKVSVGDFEHIFSKSLGGALVQREIEDLNWDEAWDDVNRHPNVVDISHSVGSIEDESVVHFVGLRLHVLDVPTVNVLLGKCPDRGLFGSDVALLRIGKTPDKAMRWG